jgi:hypothetical protein
MGGQEVRWEAGTDAVRFVIPQALLDSPSGRSLHRLLEECQADGAPTAWEGNARHITLRYALWSEAGEPPALGADAEQIDLFESRHSAFAYLLNLAAQQIRFETIGHVGSPDLSLLVSVNGKRVADAAHPTPFAFDGSGQRYPLSPCAFVAYELACRFNAKGTTDRAEQLSFVSELRSHLERAKAALTNAIVPFSFELDPHLAEFRSQRADSVSLAWKPHKNGAVFDLQLEQVAPDGTRQPLDLNKLDPNNPIIELSSTEHIVLPPDVDAVARAAKGHRNKLRKHAEKHFNNPSSVIPEGVVIENIDLSSYSPRVVGFAPIIKAERAFDIQSSGIAWYQSDGDSSEPFLRLLIAQPAAGGIESLEIRTPEEAEQVVEKLEKALEQDMPEVVTIGDRRVEPTKPLLNRIKQDLAAFRARGSAAEAAGATATGAPPLESSGAKSGRLAAVISDDVDAGASHAGESGGFPVPWATLEALLAVGIALKPHQRTAIEWLWNRYKSREPGVLLADDMGLGKTLQVAAFMALQRAAEPEVKRAPNLIVAPVILLDNWQSELRKFFKPDVFRSLLVLYGDGLRKRKRGESLDVAGLGDTDYVLTNYETLQAYQQSLLLLDWNVVVLDEAQAIKNPDTYRARAARGLKRRFGICSTGTPVENRLSDMWALYDFLRPGNPFSTIKEFEKEYETDLEAGIGKVRTALHFPSARSSLLRRTKNEVLSLPPKTVEVHPVEMTPQQVELERHITRTGEKKGNILSILQDLQKLYQHPQLLVSDAERSPSWTVERAIEESPKLACCIKILRDIKAANEKALVFTLWTRMQDLLVEVFKSHLGMKQVRVINGDPKQRRNAQKYIDELKETEGFGVLVLSPLAAGTGLTITAANHVIHYGRWWNPAKEDQATDRAYRIGQTRPVRVHYPLLHHPGKATVGFDVKLHGLVEGKRGMARDFLAPQPEETVTMEDFSKLQES